MNKYQGVHAFRLNPNQDNPREIAFDAQWRGEHKHHDLLSLLLEAKATERDRTVAATVIQWLGSAVGLSFLREALERCGYEIIQKRR